jgi:hypothetical protein
LWNATEGEPEQQSASGLLAMNVPISTVSGLMGHANPGRHVESLFALAASCRRYRRGIEAGQVVIVYGDCDD